MWGLGAEDSEASRVGCNHSCMTTILAINVLFILLLMTITILILFGEASGPWLLESIFEGT